ncbi:MAG: methionine biosynthesis protein MetW [Burkholderiaceae bacterium]|jgi:methionine biosynthesis protein MetW|nr:methionine biosynthesis protein MetW [Burkholderiaceae bacterium]
MQKLRELRADLAFIANWVPEKAHVLDLGCGDGAMLEHLWLTKGCTGYGVDIDDDKIPGCVSRGVAVIQHDLEKGLHLFADNAFDTVLFLSALQMMRNVEDLLRDIARVGNEAIVSFPNFAYWQNRLTLLTGRMPVTRELPYAWYDTPNLRCATISDFEELANQVGLMVTDCVALRYGEPVSFLRNWRGTLAVFRLKKRSPLSGR